MKRSRLSFRQILSIIAIGSAATLAGSNQVNALPSNQSANQQTKKDTAPIAKQVQREMQQRNAFGGFSGGRNDRKHIRKDHRNQRQWRKWMRSNPNMRKTKHAQ